METLNLNNIYMQNILELTYNLLDDQRLDCNEASLQNAFAKSATSMRLIGLFCQMAGVMEAHLVAEKYSEALLLSMKNQTTSQESLNFMTQSLVQVVLASTDDLLLHRDS